MIARYLRRRKIGIFASIVAGISLAKLAGDAFQFGWISPFIQIIDAYSFVSQRFSILISPYVKNILEVFNRTFEIDVSLQDNWVEIFIFCSVYLFSRVKSYLFAEKYIRTACMTVVSLFCCLISSLKFISIERIDDQTMAMVSPIFGIFIYDISYAILGGIFDRRAGQKFRAEFLRHMNYSSLPIILSIIANFVLIFITKTIIEINSYQVLTVSIFISYATISMVWLWLSYYFASKSENRRLGETISGRMERSSATDVAANVGSALLSGLGIVLAGAAWGI